MFNIENQVVDISEIESLTLRISKKIKVGDILMLKGELGVGKTTFSRFLINHLYFLNNLTKPKSINSPTFPILLTYDLNFCEVYHYDLYRIKNIEELEEIDFFDNIKNSITLIEWPELLINLPFKHKFYLINFELYKENKRIINIEYIN